MLQRPVSPCQRFARLANLSAMLSTTCGGLAVSEPSSLVSITLPLLLPPETSTITPGRHALACLGPGANLMDRQWTERHKDYA